MGLVADEPDTGGSGGGFGERGEGGDVHPGDVGEVAEVHVVGEVVGGVLAGVLLMDFNEADGVEPGVGEGGMVTAASEPVAAQDELHAKAGDAVAGSPFDEAGELAAVVARGLFAEDADLAGVGLAGQVGGRADGVVVEDGFERPVFTLGAGGEGGGAE